MRVLPGLKDRMRRILKIEVRLSKFWTPILSIEKADHTSIIYDLFVNISRKFLNYMPERLICEVPPNLINFKMLIDRKNTNGFVAHCY